MCLPRNNVLSSSPPLPPPPPSTYTYHTHSLPFSRSILTVCFYSKCAPPFHRCLCIRCSLRSEIGYFAGILPAISRDYMCNIPTVLSLSFALIFGALFAKTWRIHRIFNTEKLKVCSLCCPFLQMDLRLRVSVCAKYKVHALFIGARLHAVCVLPPLLLSPSCTHTYTQAHTYTHVPRQPRARIHMYDAFHSRICCDRFLMCDRVLRSPRKSYLRLWVHLCCWRHSCWLYGSVRALQIPPPPSPTLPSPPPLPPPPHPVHINATANSALCHFPTRHEVHRGGPGGGWGSNKIIARRQ